VLGNVCRQHRCRPRPPRAPGSLATWVSSQPSAQALRTRILWVWRYFIPSGHCVFSFGIAALAEFQEGGISPGSKRHFQECEHPAVKYPGNLPSPSSRLGFKPAKSSAPEGFPSALETSPQSRAVPPPAAMLEDAQLGDIVPPRLPWPNLHQKCAWQRG